MFFSYGTWCQCRVGKSPKRYTTTERRICSEIRPSTLITVYRWKSDAQGGEQNEAEKGLWLLMKAFLPCCQVFRFDANTIRVPSIRRDLVALVPIGAIRGLGLQDKSDGERSHFLQKQLCACTVGIWGGKWKEICRGHHYSLHLMRGLAMEVAKMRKIAGSGTTAMKQKLSRHPHEFRSAVDVLLLWLVSK